MIDGIPSRVPQSPDRRAMPRAEAVRRQHEAPQAPEPKEPTTASMQKSPAPKRKRSKKPAVLSAIIGTLLLLGVVGWFLWGQISGAAGAIDKSKHQAVFFTTGQVYFGKLEVINSSYFRLSDVFYIQSGASAVGDDSENPEQSSASGMQLIKLGDEVHAPEDEMIINRDQVLFFENLKTDGRVTELIRDYRPDTN